MKFIRKVITPDEAKEILSSKNEVNRRLEKKRVDRYANDLSNGRWETENPQGTMIIFSENGNLIDGQHRLSAICKSGISALWTVAIIPDKANASIIDRCGNRNIGNILQIACNIEPRYSNRVITSAIRNHISARNGYTRLRDTTDLEIAEYYISHKGGIEKAADIIFNCSNNSVCRKNSLFHAVYAALMMGIEEENLLSFCEIVASGFSSSEKDYPAIACRNALFKSDTRNIDRAWETSGMCEEYIRRYVNNTCQKTSVSKPTFLYTKQLFDIERNKK